MRVNDFVKFSMLITVQDLKQLKQLHWITHSHINWVFTHSHLYHSLKYIFVIHSLIINLFYTNSLIKSFIYTFIYYSLPHTFIYYSLTNTLNHAMCTLLNWIQDEFYTWTTTVALHLFQWKWHFNCIYLIDY